MIAQLRKRIFRKCKSLIGESKTRDLQYLPFRVAKKFQRGPHTKVETFVFIEGFGFFINGWILDPSGSIAKVELVQGGRRATAKAIDITNQLSSVPRPAILRRFGMASGSLKPGFTACVESADISQNTNEPHFLRLHVKNRKGSAAVRTIRIKARSSKSNALESVKDILKSVPSGMPEKRYLFDKSFGPAITEVWARRERFVSSVEQISYNSELAPPSPKISLIVPVYGRYDFIEYQLSIFVNDPDMFNHEIIYVIDDPRICNEVKTVCEAYGKIYRIPFKVLYLERNMGFAGANNIGVRHASAESLLLVNSDVMPSSAGWLEALQASAGSRLERMMLGVRLLYEDDTIQHDGMKFFSSPFVNDLWTNIHPHKGLHKSIVKTDKKLQDREAITGACILMSKSVYNRLEGFDENFILGDYEDSDLCMRARQMGIEIKMNSNITLYHLERQSQSLVTSDRWKAELTYYNCWYHTQKWDNAIKIMQDEVVNA